MSEQNGADNVSGPVPWLVETWDDEDFRKMGNDQVLSAAVRQVEWLGENKEWSPRERQVREMLVAGGYSLPHFYLPPYLDEARNVLAGVAGWGLDSMDMHTFLGLEDAPFDSLAALRSMGTAGVPGRLEHLQQPGDGRPGMWQIGETYALEGGPEIRMHRGFGWDFRSYEEQAARWQKLVAQAVKEWMERRGLEKLPVGYGAGQNIDLLLDPGMKEDIRAEYAFDLAAKGMDVIKVNPDVDDEGLIETIIHELDHWLVQLLGDQILLTETDEQLKARALEASRFFWGETDVKPKGFPDLLAQGKYGPIVTEASEAARLELEGTRERLKAESAELTEQALAGWPNGMLWTPLDTWLVQQSQGNEEPDIGLGFDAAMGMTGAEPGHGFQAGRHDDVAGGPMLAALLTAFDTMQTELNTIQAELNAMQATLTMQTEYTAPPGVGGPATIPNRSGRQQTDTNNDAQRGQVDASGGHTWTDGLQF